MPAPTKFKGIDMNRKVLLLIGALTLSSCSLIADKAIDAITPESKGIDIDAQVGSNENKVDTGIGSVGSDRKTSQTIEDNNNVNVRNTDGKFHIESTEGVNITVEETNGLVYYLMGFFFILTLVREFFNWRRKDVK